MRTLELSPFYRSTIGYEQLFDALEHSIRPDWPPYNIVKKGDDDYFICMAVAGFSADEITLTQQGNTLLVESNKQKSTEEHQVLHQGIASRNFRQTFNLADHVKVVSADMENGLLQIDLVREIPEALKPRTIQISGTRSSESAERKQLNRRQAAEAKAA